jgi:Novel toxin 16
MPYDIFDDDIDALIDDWLDGFDPFDIDDFAMPSGPPGSVCTWQRHFALRHPINLFCKSFRASRCEERHNCSDLRQRLFWWMQCVNARNNMTRECYPDGDAGHITAQRIASNAAKRCTRLLTERRCQRA